MSNHKSGTPALQGGEDVRRALECAEKVIKGDYQGAPDEHEVETEVLNLIRDALDGSLGMDASIMIKNARIVNTSLGPDHGSAFTFSISLDYGRAEGSGGSQRAGHLELGSPDGTWEGAVPILLAIMHVVGVESWEELPDKYVRVKAAHDKVYAIGNLIEDKWLDFAEFAKKFSGATTVSFAPPVSVSAVDDLERMKRDLDEAGHPSNDYKDEDIPDAHRRLLQTEPKRIITKLTSSTESSVVEIPEGAQVIGVDYVIESISGTITPIGSYDRLLVYLAVRDGRQRKDISKAVMEATLLPSPDLPGKIKRRFTVLVPGTER